MSADFPERDWKTLSSLQTVLLNRLCQKILDEAKTEIERPEKSSHERYRTLFQIILDRDKDIAGAFNGLRRSTAFLQLGVIYSLGLLTPDDLQRFSPETAQRVTTTFRIRKD
jgi:hypothetical protein